MRKYKEVGSCRFTGEAGRFCVAGGACVGLRLPKTPPLHLRTDMSQEVYALALRGHSHRAHACKGMRLSLRSAAKQRLAHDDGSTQGSLDCIVSEIGRWIDQPDDQINQVTSNTICQLLAFLIAPPSSFRCKTLREP